MRRCRKANAETHGGALLCRDSMTGRSRCQDSGHGAARKRGKFGEHFGDCVLDPRSGNPCGAARQHRALRPRTARPPRSGRCRNRRDSGADHRRNESAGPLRTVDSRRVRGPGPDDGGRSRGRLRAGANVAGVPLADRHQQRHRLAGHHPGRHRGTEGAVAAQARIGRAGRVVRADRTGLRLRCGVAGHDGQAHRRSLCAQRHQALHHQCARRPASSR